MLTAPDIPIQESPLKGGESYYGILVWFVDIGTHETTYMNERKFTRQCVMTFEFPELLIKDGDTGEESPMVRSMRLTFSMASTANLRKHIEKWYGKQFETDEDALRFDFEYILGKSAMCDIMLSKKGNPYIDAIRKAPKAEKSPYNPLIIWGFSTGEEIPSALPDWMKKLIMESREWNEGEGQRGYKEEQYEYERTEKLRQEHEPDFGEQYSTVGEPDDVPF